MTTEGRTAECGYEWANEFHPPGSGDPGRMCIRPSGHTGQHCASGWWFDTRPENADLPPQCDGRCDDGREICTLWHGPRPENAEGSE